VLINAGSASASEAFSGAMQDYGRAHLVGETSAGCLAAAMIFPLADGSAMNITIQKILSPKGHEINRVGVHPDEAVPPDPNSVADPQFQAAHGQARRQHERVAVHLRSFIRQRNNLTNHASRNVRRDP